MRHFMIELAFVMSTVFAAQSSSSALVASAWDQAVPAPSAIRPPLDVVWIQDAPRQRLRGARYTIAPWLIRVLGKEFDNFSHDEASIVLTDWMVNSLSDLGIFHVVSRDQMEVVLSEHGLVEEGFTVTPRDLANLRQILKADYILQVSVKNLSDKSGEVDFKLLNVSTTEYHSHAATLEIPFSAEIEKMKPEIDRMVARLAAGFPMRTRIDEIVNDDRIRLGAGVAHGISESMGVEICKIGGRADCLQGSIVEVHETSAEVELHEPGEINLHSYFAKVKVVPPAQAALEDGKRLLRVGRFGEAIEVFRRGLESDSKDSLLHAWLARALWRIGDQEDALEAYREAILLRPDAPEIVEDAAAAMLASGRLQELIDRFGGEQSAASARLTLLVGQGHELRGDYSRAREIYRQVSKEKPRFAGAAHLRLGLLEAQRGELDEADREILRANRRGGDSLEFEIAQRCLEALRGLDLLRAKESLAPLLVSAEEEKDFQALTSASELLALEPSFWTLSRDLALRSLQGLPYDLRATLAAARAYALGGERPEAIDLLDRALETVPDNVPLLLFLGKLLAQEGQDFVAESRFLWAAKLAVDDCRPWSALGDLYLRQQEYGKAADAYRGALERGENHNHLWEHHQKLGRARFLAKEYPEAIEALDHCVSIQPENKQCRYDLGRSYFEFSTEGNGSLFADHQARARSHFMRVSEFADSFYHLGKIEESRGAFGEAEEFYQQCLASGHDVVPQCAERIDWLESLTGSVTAVKLGRKGREITLDMGQDRGLSRGQRGVVVDGTRIVAAVEVEEVHATECRAVVVGRGEPRAGETVRFRPTRLHNVQVKAHPRRGVVVSWRLSGEPEVESYEVYTRASPDERWRFRKKIRHPRREHWEKSARPDEERYFRVVAVSEHGAKSRNNDIVSINGDAS